MITIGLPRAMLYYKYRRLWETFFAELDCQTVVSGETSRRTLADGAGLSIDECCTPAKIYMGHVHSLIGRCDYILVPRIDNFGKKDLVCVKFNAMYDIVKNTFKGVPLLCYNIDATHGERERKGFMLMGKALGKSRLQTLCAYRRAKQAHKFDERCAAAEQEQLLEQTERPKILIVTHAYNINDRLLGYPVVRLIESLGGLPVYAGQFDSAACIKAARGISRGLYWTYSKELAGAVELFKDKVDGMLFITAFPCGPDSLVNELLLRRLKGVPAANIILDELEGEAGLQTRIESFMDILLSARTADCLEGA